MLQRTTTSALADLYRHISSSRRRQFYLLLGLMILGAFAELLAIGAVLPFLSLLAQPGSLNGVGALVALFDIAGAASERERLLVVTASFVTAVLAAGAVRLVLAWATQAFSFRIGHDLGLSIYERLMYQPYPYHVSHNSSQLVAAQEKINSLLFNVIVPFMLTVTAAIISVFIIGILVYVDILVALVAAASFGFLYLAVSFLTRQRLQLNSEIINASYGMRVQALTEGLGGIRDVILDQSQPIHLAKFRNIDRRFRDAQIITAFIGSAPRFLVEAAGMILIASLALLVSGRTGGIAGALPLLGVLALGAQRLLPLLQQIYHGWTQIRGSRALTEDIVALLNLVPQGQEYESQPPPLSFEQEIRFSGLGFSYPARREPVLSDIDLVIPMGTSLALIGKTGSGKSTLVDLLLGLLEPTTGRLTIDGVEPAGPARRRWQAQIAHVPQSIFLADATIARNIAFASGDEEVDLQRVEVAARRAQLHEFIMSLPEGYQTGVGERGVQLSGGQRQRLGIARALYQNAPVLVLDEATSALDPETEAAVIRSLRFTGERTIVMIAHRLTTLKHCDLVVRLDGGKIVESGSYKAVVEGLELEQN